MIPDKGRRVLLTKLESSAKSLLTPLAKFKLRQMMKRGFPAHLCPPFLYLLTKKVSEEDAILFSRIEGLRKSSGKGGKGFRVVRETRGAGGINEAIQVSLEPEWLQQVSSVSRYWGAFLHLCANAVEAKTILELGCCIGMSGCYLATGTSCNQFITIEGSDDLVPIAESNLRRMVDHFRVIHALFEEGLDRLLPSLREPLDLVHIDGDHTEEKTLHYFQRLIPHLRAGSLVMFDDIHFSPGMLNAWWKLCRWNGVAWSINVGRYGILVWDGRDRIPDTFDLSLYASEWGRGHRVPE